MVYKLGKYYRLLALAALNKNNAFGLGAEGIINYLKGVNLMSLKVQVLLGKVWKGFLAGGLAAVALKLQQEGFEVNTLTDLAVVGQVVVSAFISGGFLALLKWWVWKP